MSHTPGEWVAECFSNGAFDVVARFQGSNGGKLVLASRQSYEGREKEMHANAHIFAAAPDLLDALKSIDARLRECSSGSILASEAYDTFYQEIVSEAIAKAKGQA